MNEVNELPHLSIGEWSPITVADEADADGVQVVLIRADGCMRAVELLIPSIPDLNDAIAEAVPIADDEVIAKSAHSGGEMLAVQRIGVACGFTRGMDEDSGPFARLNGRLRLSDRVLPGGRRFGDESRAGGDKARAERAVTDDEQPADDGHGGNEACPHDRGST